MSSYRRKAYRVSAVQVQTEKYIRTTEGEQRFRPTDWLVTEDNGDQHRLDDEMFKLKFEIDPPPGNPTRR